MSNDLKLLVSLSMILVIQIGLQSIENDPPIIFYDVDTKEIIPMTILGNESVDATRSTTFHVGRSNGCRCGNLTCGCCVGINITLFHFDREGCMQLAYDPYAFSVTMSMLFNNNTVYTSGFSAKNPPPVCIPVPIPYIPNVDFCALVYDIYTPGRNIHMCLDLEFRIQRATVFVLQFDCMQMGFDGIALVKPDDGASTTVAPARESTPANEEQEASDIFDPITEIKYSLNISQPSYEIIPVEIQKYTNTNNISLH